MPTEVRILLSPLCGCSSVGRASAFQAECREFEPRRPLNRAMFGIPAWFTCELAAYAYVAQMVEHVLGKDGVTGSSPVVGSEVEN